MNEYFFWMDSKFVTHVPQPAQRILAQNYLEKINGKIVYYSAEELISVEKQLGLKEKLKRTSGISGFIFFTLKQFNYGAQIDFHLMKTILEMGFEIHFVREEYAIVDLQDLKEKFTRLCLYNASNGKHFALKN